MILEITGIQLTRDLEGMCRVLIKTKNGGGKYVRIIEDNQIIIDHFVHEDGIKTALKAAGEEV